MTKFEFLTALEARLHTLAPTERAALLACFEELIADRTEYGLSEAEAIAQLGPVDTQRATLDAASGDIEFSGFARAALSVHTVSSDIHATFPLPSAVSDCTCTTVSGDIPLRTGG